MAKENYIWIFSSDELRSGLAGPFSLEYHISRLKLSVEVASLLDSKIWLLVKSKGDLYLYGFITPHCIEQYEEGAYEGDFLLHASPFSSIRLLPRLESSDTWVIPNVSSQKEGIRTCSNEELLIFAGLIDQNNRVSFGPPSKTLLSSVPKTVYIDRERAVLDQMALVLRALAFGDVTRSRAFPHSVSAMGGLALHLLGQGEFPLNDEESVSLVTSLDPLSPGGEAVKIQRKVDKSSVAFSLIVDTFLEKINPEQIFPRTFVAKSKNYSLHWLEKTNQAEKNHEEILKDLVLFLNGEGFETFKSRSFDLYSKKNGIEIVWEVKSANAMNSMEQGERGIVQLLRYATALSEHGNNDVRFHLLLQSSSKQGSYHYLSRMAKKAGVELFIYDKNRKWPDRVFGVDVESPW